MASSAMAWASASVGICPALALRVRSRSDASFARERPAPSSRTSDARRTCCACGSSGKCSVRRWGTDGRGRGARGEGARGEGVQVAYALVIVKNEKGEVLQTSSTVPRE